MSIASICQRAVDTARVDETILVCAKRMASRCVGTLVVVDDDQRPIGIITDRDLAVRAMAAGLDPAVTMVADVASMHVVTIGEHATIEAALGTMHMDRVRRLPIVDRAGHLVGIVSFEDVLARLARQMADVGGLLQGTAPARQLAASRH